MANQASPIDVTGGPENRAGGPSRLHRKLTEAIRHVDEGQRIVARQRELVSALKANGHETAYHERTLQVFENTMRWLEHHERLLRREIAEEFGEGGESKPSPPSPPRSWPKTPADQNLTERSRSYIAESKELIDRAERLLASPSFRVAEPSPAISRANSANIIRSPHR
jgi:hypothetical protein